MTRKRTILLLIGILTILVVATWAILARTGATRLFVERALAKFIRSDFQLDAADLDLRTGTLEIVKFILRDPKRKSPLLQVRDLSLSVDTNPLGEVGAVQRVRAAGLELHFSLVANEMPDLAEILHLERFRSADPNAPPAPLPAVQIVDSRVLVQMHAGAPPVEFHDLTLDLLPVEGGGKQMALAGSMTSSLGRKFTLRGSGDPDKHEFRILLSAEGIPVTPQTARAFQPKVAEYLERCKLAGVVDQLSIWAEHPPRAGEGSNALAFSAGASASISGLSCEAPDLPYPFRNTSAKISASLKDRGSVTFTLVEQSALAAVSAGGTITHLLDASPLADVRLSAKDVIVDETLARVVQSQEPGRDVWQAFQPRGGRADAQLRVWVDEPGEKPDFAMDLTLAGVRASFLGFEPPPGQRKVSFPYALSDLHGQVQVRPGTSIAIHDVRGTCDGGDIVVSGKVQTARGKGTTAQIDVTGKNLRFSKELRAALHELEPEAAKVWDEYSPVGRADTNVRVRSEPGGKPADLAIEIVPRGASATFAGFPYRVDEITGKIAIGADAVALDLSGKRDATEVVLRGRFSEREDPADGLRSTLTVRGKRVPFDAEIRGALQVLDPAIDAVWQSLSPGGACDCEAVLWKEAGKPDFTYDVRLDLAGATARGAGLQIPIVGLEGPVVIHGSGTTTRAEICAVRGRIANEAGRPPASCLLHGTVVAAGGHTEMDVTGIVRALDLSPSLGAALDASGVFSLSTWEMLRPSGGVNVVLRFEQTREQKEPTQHLRVQLVNAVSHAAVLPGPATQLSGEVVVSAGKATFEELSCTIGGARVLCKKGVVQREAAGDRFTTQIIADELPVNRGLANLFTGPLKQAFLDRGMNGTMRVNELNVRLLFPRDAPGFSAELDGRFEAKDIALSLGADIERVHGVCNLTRVVIDAGGGRIEGNLRDVSFRIQGHPVTGFTGTFVADPETLEFADLTLRLHQGIARGRAGTGPALRYEYARENTSLHLRVDGMSLSEFLSVDGQVAAYRGTLSADLDLDHLHAADFVDLDGRAGIAITDGKLGEVPLFKAIYRMLPEDKRPKFEGLDVELIAKDRKIAVPRLALRSPFLQVEGQGTVTMDGYLDLDLEFPELFGAASSVLILPEILRKLTNTFVSFSVYGYLRDPHSRERFLLSGAPEHRQLEPIPARLPPRALIRF